MVSILPLLAIGLLVWLVIAFLVAWGIGSAARLGQAPDEDQEQARPAHPPGHASEPPPPPDQHSA